MRKLLTQNKIWNRIIVLCGFIIMAISLSYPRLQIFNIYNCNMLCNTYCPTTKTISVQCNSHITMLLNSGLSMGCGSGHTGTDRWGCYKWLIVTSVLWRVKSHFLLIHLPLSLYHARRHSDNAYLAGYCSYWRLLHLVITTLRLL